MSERFLQKGLEKKMKKESLIDELNGGDRKIKAVINVSREEVIGIVTERLAKIFIQHGVADCDEYFVNISEDPAKFFQFIFAENTASSPNSDEDYGQVQDVSC